MYTIFSWMLTNPGTQVRFVVAQSVVIRMDHEWEGEKWTVRWAVMTKSPEDARRLAVQETEDLESVGFALSGPVTSIVTDVSPATLYLEGSYTSTVGPSLRGLFGLTWAEL